MGKLIIIRFISTYFSILFPYFQFLCLKAQNTWDQFTKILLYTYKSNIWVYKHTYDIAYHSSELGRVFLTTCNTIIQDCNGIREDAKRKREILIRSRYIIHKVFHTCIAMVPHIVVLKSCDSLHIVFIMFLNSILLFPIYDQVIW